MYVLEDTDTASYIQKHISIKLTQYFLISLLPILILHKTIKVSSAALLSHYDVRCVVCVLNWTSCLCGTSHILKHMTHSNMFACLLVI